MEQALLDLLKELKSLNVDQLTRCQTAAKADVLGRLGPAPDRKDYTARVSWRQVAQPADYVGVVLFVVLLIISLTHMLTFTGAMANSSFNVDQAAEQGVFLQLQAWVITHQLGFFSFSELGVLFFIIRHTLQYTKWRESMESKGLDPDAGRGSLLRKFVSRASLAALACAVIAIVANVESLTHGIEDDLQMVIAGSVGVLIPLLTIFLGERAAEILIDYLIEREKQGNLYLEDLARWRLAEKDPESYDEGDRVHTYRHYLARRIVQYYKEHVAPNNRFDRSNWTAELETALAGRELARLRQMSAIDEAEAFFSQPSPQDEAEREGRSTTTPSMPLSPASSPN